MKKIYLEKNCLDLAYQKNLQFLNAVLVVGAGSLIAFFGGLILNFDKWFSYSLVLISVGFLTSYTYHKTDNNLKNISNRIK